MVEQRLAVAQQAVADRREGIAALQEVLLVTQAVEESIMYGGRPTMPKP